MKAISLWQPWATLIAIGAKKIETRSWEPPAWMPGVAGHKLAIHAAKTMNHLDHCFTEPFKTKLLEAGYYPGSKPLPHGAFVAVCTIKRVRPITEEAALWLDQYNPPEFAFGDYDLSRGPRFAWVLADVEPLPDPVPAVGHQKLWDVSDDAVYGGALF